MMRCTANSPTVSGFHMKLMQEQIYFTIVLGMIKCRQVLKPWRHVVLHASPLLQNGKSRGPDVGKSEEPVITWPLYIVYCVSFYGLSHI